MAFKSSDAWRAAKDNARYFNRPYIVFADTNGNWRSESLGRDTHVCYGVVHPDGREYRSTVQTTAGELLVSSMSINRVVAHLRQQWLNARTVSEQDSAMRALGIIAEIHGPIE